MKEVVMAVAVVAVAAAAAAMRMMIASGVYFLFYVFVADCRVSVQNEHHTPWHVCENVMDWSWW